MQRFFLTLFSFWYYHIVAHARKSNIGFFLFADVCDKEIFLINCCKYLLNKVVSVRKYCKYIHIVGPFRKTVVVEFPCILC